MSHRCSSATRSASAVPSATRSRSAVNWRGVGAAVRFRFGDYEYPGIEMNLLGTFSSTMPQNCRRAVPAVGTKEVVGAGRRRKSKSAILRACATTKWPGRLEIIAQDPLTVIDVGTPPTASGNRWQTSGRSTQ